MKKLVDKFTVYNLRETYHELGRYDFKIVLNPKYFKTGHCCTMKMVDSDGNPMKFELNKWGRKLNCSFDISNAVSDGVSFVTLDLRNEENKLVETGYLRFWVIKP